MANSNRTPINHIGSSHLLGDACPHCHYVHRQVERAPGGGSVLLSAAAVHVHSCRYWRMGNNHGPCTCGANEAWERNREALGNLVLGPR